MTIFKSVFIKDQTKKFVLVKIKIQISNFLKRFFQILRAGFTHKRKLLRSNLAGLVELTDQVRAEDVGLEQWLEFSRRES